MQVLWHDEEWIERLNTKALLCFIFDVDLHVE